MSIGKRLAAARAERGLELEDVSRATRIRVPILAALEADDLAAAGPPAYVRGHLRTLAGLLGLDPAALVADFERHAPAAPTAPETWQVRDRAVARADRRSPTWLGATVVTMAAVVALLLVGVVVEQPDDRLDVATAPPAATAPAAPQPAPDGGVGGGTAAPDGAARDGPAPGPAAPSEAGVTGRGSGATTPVAARVRVSVEVRRSWVEVVDETGRTLHAAVLRSGETEEFTADRELRLTLGDASATRVEVDGRPVDVPGGKGDIARLRVEPGGAVTAG